MLSQAKATAEEVSKKVMSCVCLRLQTHSEHRFHQLMSLASSSCHNVHVLVWVNVQMKEVEETEKEVDAMRELYVPVAKRATVLYFCLAELALVDPMYQFSLSW